MNQYPSQIIKKKTRVKSPYIKILLFTPLINYLKIAYFSFVGQKWQTTISMEVNRLFIIVVCCCCFS